MRYLVDYRILHCGQCSRLMYKVQEETSPMDNLEYSPVSNVDG